MRYDALYALLAAERGVRREVPSWGPGLPPGAPSTDPVRALPRRARMVSISVVGSRARTRTAAASPSGSQTKFSRLWMPYER